MKAVRFHVHGGPEVLRYEEAPEPSPSPVQAKVAVRAVALNHLDVWVRKGLPGITVPLPKIGGCDIAGQVVAAGALCTRIAPGARVMVSPGTSCGQCAACLAGDDNLCRAYQIIGGYALDGGCAEFVCVPEVNCIPTPGALDDVQAAAAPLTFLTAWNMLVRQGRVRRGDWVLVMAAGSGIGTAAVQIARLHGAKVIAVAGTDAKLQKARELGADVTLRSAEAAASTLRQVTGKRGVDVVVEHVGGGTWAGILPAIAAGGRLVTCGASAGFEVPVDLRHLFAKQIAILGAHMGRKADLLEIVRHLADGALRPVVDRVLPLRDCAEGHRLLERHEVFGKIVLKP
ncbi:MAG: zinc-binding dehydrogenase [Candidatus Methylomirabilales bacterium]